jgi:hypothetical protein
LTLSLANCILFPLDVTSVGIDCCCGAGVLLSSSNAPMIPSIS